MNHIRIACFVLLIALVPPVYAIAPLPDPTIINSAQAATGWEVTYALTDGVKALTVHVANNPNPA